MRKDEDGSSGRTGAAGSADAAGARREQRSFERRVESLPAIVAFCAAFFDRHGIDPALLLAVDFAIEELFTNMVKYGAGSSAPVAIALTAIAGGVEVTLTDRDVPPFDVTQAPDADVTLPVEERVPGGLGLHLTRRMVDAMQYEYSPERRESRIIFRKTGTATGGRTVTQGGNRDDDDRVGR